MNGISIAVALAAVIGIALLLAARLASDSRLGSSRGKALKVTRASHGGASGAPRKPYQSVSLVPGPSACEAVRNNKDQRFLTREAPLLPLEGCGTEKCACKYVHHEDRRDGMSERRLPASLSTELFQHTGRPDRRMQRGRRASDWQTA
jgi:hypothetical protein